MTNLALYFVLICYKVKCRALCRRHVFWQTWVTHLQAESEFSTTNAMSWFYCLLHMKIWELRIIASASFSTWPPPHTVVWSVILYCWRCSCNILHSIHGSQAHVVMMCAVLLISQYLTQIPKTALIKTLQLWSVMTSLMCLVSRAAAMHRAL